MLKCGTNSANFMKIAERGMPLRGVYIPHFISVKISVVGSYTVTVPMGVKLGIEEGTLLLHAKFGMDLLHAKFNPHRCHVVTPAGQKPQNRPLSKLNTGALRLAQCYL